MEGLFREYVSSKHQNINFSVKHGDIGLLSFSKHGKYITSVYRKPIVGEVFTIYESFILAYKKEELYHVL